MSFAEKEYILEQRKIWRRHMFNFLPHSVLQMSTIFLSIVIEAIPFVLLGCLISGALQVYLTPERVQKILPNNKLLAILVGSFLGFFFLLFYVGKLKSSKNQAFTISNSIIIFVFPITAYFFTMNCFLLL